MSESELGWATNRDREDPEAERRRIRRQEFPKVKSARAGEAPRVGPGETFARQPRASGRDAEREADAARGESASG